MQREFTFDGATYNHERDSARLTGQMLRVWECISDGKWRTLKEISEATGDPESSISARLRDLRKPRFGSYNIERMYVDKGLFKYRIEITI